MNRSHPALLSHPGRKRRMRTIPQNAKPSHCMQSRRNPHIRRKRRRRQPFSSGIAVPPGTEAPDVNDSRRQPVLPVGAFRAESVHTGGVSGTQPSFTSGFPVPPGTKTPDVNEQGTCFLFTPGHWQHSLNDGRSGQPAAAHSLSQIARTGQAGLAHLGHHVVVQPLLVDTAGKDTLAVHHVPVHDRGVDVFRRRRVRQGG